MYVFLLCLCFVLFFQLSPHYIFAADLLSAVTQKEFCSLMYESSGKAAGSWSGDVRDFWGSEWGKGCGQVVSAEVTPSHIDDNVFKTLT